MAASRLKAARLAFALVAAAGFVAGPQSVCAAPTGGGPSAPASKQAIDAEAAYADGIAALAASDYKRAEKRFSEVLTVTPDHPEANYYIGLAKRRLGKDRQALRHFARAVRARESFTEAREALALTAIALGEREQAAAELAALRARAAACTPASCNEATRARLDEAAARVSAALDAAGTGEPATDDEGDPLDDEARAAPTRYAAALFGRDAGAADFRIGVALVNQERFAEAIEAFERAGAAIGPHPDVLNYLGFSLRRLGRLEEAERRYAAALALDPGHLGANEYLGELYAETGDLQRARGQLARLDRLCPYGCAEREDLARRIAVAESVRSAS